MRRLAMRLLPCAALLVGAGPAAAVSFGFGCISNNSATDCATGEAQLAVDVTAGPGASQVSFKFTNTGPNASSIADVYFDDGTLLGIASILDGTGVDFEEGANPSNLPAGNNVDPDFDADFSADSEPPVQPNGVNPGEELTIVFDLASGFTFADTLAALGDGSLRIGIHVQGFDCEADDLRMAMNDGEHHKNGCEEECEGSESFVNTVPEPSSAMLMLGTGLLGLAYLGRKR